MGNKIMLAVLLTLITLGVDAGTPIKIYGTYSSLAYNQEGGDLLGYEVRIIPTKEGLKAMVQAAEGEPGNVYVVDVTQKADVLSFDIPLIGQKPARYEGKLSDGGLNGRIIFSSGTSETVFLKRTTSYWDR